MSMDRPPETDVTRLRWLIPQIVTFTESVAQSLVASQPQAGERHPSVEGRIARRTVTPVAGTETYLIEYEIERDSEAIP